jgi:CheY-like chemotaxis protein
MIGAIMGWADIGFNDAPAGSREQDRFHKIRTQADRAAALTRQLLAFARRQVLQPKNTDLNELIREEVKLLWNVIGERIEIHLELAEDLRLAFADPGQIEQVLMNLCLNARDAMPTGGRLLIETRNVEILEDHQRVHTDAAPGWYVMLRVLDTGVGMDAKTLEHIFEPFFSTKEIGKGTGLGLATVYGIVKQHKGAITVDSSPGKGTSFQVYLPMGEGQAETVAPNLRWASTLKPGGETILVAEDNEGLREAAKEILESLGYTVILAPDGEAAVRVFRQASESIDLLLLDVVMPKLNGSEAYSQMSAIRKNVPVIFTTGYATEGALVGPRSLENAVLLQKPYGSEYLAQKLREMLEKTPH